ncbi:MAG: UPF0175 family protein [Phycisphaerae bacterium]
MTLAFPDSVLEEAGLTAEQFRVEIALALYSNARLSLGHCAELIGMDRVQFHALLADRHVPVTYCEADFRNDLDTLRLLDRQ